MKVCCTSCVAAFVAGGIITGGLIAAGGFAQQPGDTRKPAATPPSSPVKPGDKPAGQPEMPAMPPEMMELMGPGPEHALLKQFDGKWNGKVETFGMMQGTSTGVMTNTWVLDGRWLRQEWNGTFFEQPFKGLGYWGYDRGAKKWTGTWMDTWGTGIMISYGTYDAGKQSWSLTGKFTDPMGQEQTMREVITVKNANEHTMEMFGDEDHDGKEELMMRITYTKAK